MNADQQQPEKREYQVQVGQHSVTVKAESEAEALRIARRRLGIDLPRLWDMIYTMQDTDFDIQQMQ